MSYKIVYSVDDLPQFNGSVFSDIETSGLYVDVRLIQFYDPTVDDKIYILDLAPSGYDEEEYIFELKKVKELILKNHTVWFNASYDLGTFNISPEKVDDLYYAVKIAYPQFQKFSLDVVASKLPYLYDLYKDIDKKEMHKTGFPKGSYISSKQLRYSADDVIALSRMWKDPKFRNVIQNNLAYKVDILSLRYALVYQQNGLLLNREAWEKELVIAKEGKEKVEKELPEGLNVNSPKQVKEYLDISSTGVDKLIEYALSNKPLAKKAEAIINLRKYKKQVKYLESINYNKMVTKFNVAGAITGRFTSSGGDIPNGFNAQQIPRNYQYLFNSPTEDTEVIGLDYGTLELRLATAIYNEPAMYQQFKEGKDLHTEMAILVSGKQLHPDGIIENKGSKSDSLNNMVQEYITTLDRIIAKSLNFGFVFGMSASTYQNYVYSQFGLKVSLEDSEKFRNLYFKKYPNIKKYHNHIWKNYSKPGFTISTALGRKISPRMGTDGINGPVQGTGVETTKLAVHYLVKDNPDYQVLKYIYNVVHDAIYLRIPRGTKDFWEDKLREAMLKAWREISKTALFHFKDIPMIVD